MRHILARMVIKSDIVQARDIADIIRIDHDRIWAPGDKRFPDNEKLVYKEHGWMIESALDDTASTEMHVNDILERVSDRIGAIASLEHCSRVVQCILYCKDRPSLHFSESTIEKISALKAAFDVDVYFLEGKT